MRVSDVNKDNYKDYMKLLGIKDSKVLDKLFGKDKEAKNYDKSIEEINAELVRKGYAEEGMFLKEGDQSYRQKIVPVSDEIRDKLIETVRRQFLTNANGTHRARDGDEIGAIMKEYRANIPPSERLAVTWTLSQIVQNENARLVELLKAHDPNWDYGQRFDANVIKNLISGPSIDQRV